MARRSELTTRCRDGVTGSAGVRPPANHKPPGPRARRQRARSGVAVTAALALTAVAGTLAESGSPTASPAPVPTASPAAASPAPASPAPLKAPPAAPLCDPAVPRAGRHGPLDEKERQAALAALNPALQKRLSRLSPDQRAKFVENWRKWRNLSDEERVRFFWRTIDEKERQKAAIDDAIEKLGLEFDSDRREVFALRYRQERKKIEETLCREADAKRRVMIGEMLGRLKEEFAAFGKPAATSAAPPHGATSPQPPPESPPR